MTFDGVRVKTHGIVFPKETLSMHNEFPAIIEKDGDWYIAYCLEVPGANGQGKTRE